MGTILASIIGISRLIPIIYAKIVVILKPLEFRNNCTRLLETNVEGTYKYKPHFVSDQKCRLKDKKF